MDDGKTIWTRGTPSGLLRRLREVFARFHGFRSIGIDLSPDYCDLAATALSSDPVGVD